MSCLPFLRTLLLRVVKKSSMSTFGYHTHRTRTAYTADRMTTMQDLIRSDNVANETLVTGGKGRPSLSGSEEAMLNDTWPMRKDGGILRTTKVETSSAGTSVA